MLDKAIIRGRHQAFRYVGLQKVWEWCKACQQQLPCDVIQLLDEIEAKDDLLRRLASAAATLQEFRAQRYRVDYMEYLETVSWGAEDLAKSILDSSVVRALLAEREKTQ